MDWLLGLSQDEQQKRPAAGTRCHRIAAGLPADERLQQWHAEASGFQNSLCAYVAARPVENPGRDLHEYRLSDQRLPALRCSNRRGPTGLQPALGNRF